MPASKRASLEDNPLSEMFQTTPPDAKPKKGAKAKDVEQGDPSEIIRSTVLLEADLAWYVDDVSRTVRRSGNKKIGKSAVVRALIRLLQSADDALDLSAVWSEEELPERFKEAILAQEAQPQDGEDAE